MARLGHVWRVPTRGLGTAWSPERAGRGLGRGMTRERSCPCMDEAVTARSRVFRARRCDKAASFCMLGAAIEVAGGWGQSDGRAAAGCWQELAQLAPEKEKERGWSGEEGERRKKEKMEETEKKKKWFEFTRV